MTLTLSRRWIFLGFLLAFHLVLLQGPANELGRLLFLSHIGLGLLWQPFVQPRRRLGFFGTTLVVLFSGVTAYFLNWWLLGLWAMLLSGVVGGKVFLFHGRAERLFYLLGLGYLAAIVFTVIMPKALMTVGLMEPLLVGPMLIFSPALFFLMALLPAERQEVADRAEIVDYVYGVMVFLLLTVIVLGSLSFALLIKQSYIESLLMTLALVAGVLLLLGFIWDPRSGFGGLGHAVMQHMMSLGMPLEDWVDSLAQLAEKEVDADRFLSLACARLPEGLPGVLGGDWKTPNGGEHFGKRSGHLIELSYGPLKLDLHARVNPSPALLWQYQLAARLLAEFYLGKWRAEELKRLSYVEAIHETGARLTHDVKNLLQALDTLCAAAELDGSLNSTRFNELVRRQLPEISMRLHQTLAKLGTPGKPASSGPQNAQAWLAGLKRRYSLEWLEFAPDAVPADSAIPDAALFSSIVENLLQNIVEKRHKEPTLRANIRLHAGMGMLSVEVEDDGQAIPEAVAKRLFAYSTSSESGFGIGLYQSGRLAEQLGFRLALSENRDGCVRFSLEPQAAGS